MDAVKQYQDEVRVRRALDVMDYQVQRGCSVQEACEACNVAKRTFYRWLNEGVLVDHVAGCLERAGRRWSGHGHSTRSKRS